jgi:hypothetical protein
VAGCARVDDEQVEGTGFGWSAGGGRRARLWREGCALLAAAAERELEKAIDWGTHELGEGFVVVREG